MRVGLQKISHSRSLHKQIRLQVERQEVELPSIEGLIFINIPRCSRAPQRLCQAGPPAGSALVPPAPTPLCPLSYAAAGVLGPTCGAQTATPGLRSRAWMMGCWRWWA